MQIHHTGIKNFSCDQCGNAYSGKKALADHIKSIHEGLSLKILKCDSCEKTYAKPYDLKMHIKTEHLNIKDFHC